MLHHIKCTQNTQWNNIQVLFWAATCEVYMYRHLCIYICPMATVQRETFEGENFREFRRFVAIREIWGRGILWRGKSEQSTKVFSAKIVFFTNLRKFSAIRYMQYGLSLLWQSQFSSQTIAYPIFNNSTTRYPRIVRATVSCTQSICTVRKKHCSV